ncbi:FAD-dependent monooxygenase [Membranihabitans marinus]|uniref:FAD-dependent monooxygenase n=1 Tax=Membranihabitans marinus TaxID=1227546 RepID=UPI001F004BA2|nr:FAD-dependent monooxygenase [Membranihabitans marinus]
MKIAIIGGGITGLTTAIALRKLGIPAEIFEQSEELKEVGAGIMLQPNAMKILDRLHLGNTIREHGIILHRMEITDQDLHPLKDFENGINNDVSNQIIGIHRGRLQQILYNALPPETVHLGHTYSSHSSNNGTIEIKFQDSTYTADVLLGADGIHSKVRQQLFPTASLRDSQQVCWRGISPIPLPPDLRHVGRESWGPGKRFGITQVSAEKTYWFAVLNSSVDISLDPNYVKSDLQNQFKDFAPIVNQIIEHTASTQIIRGDLFDLKRLPTWHLGSVCLLGDAAHAMTPNMGQGAGQGIEDSYCMSNVLNQNKTPKRAFEKFETLRRKKVDYIVNNSWRFGKMAHSTTGQFFLKLIMKFSPHSVVLSQMKKLYAVHDFENK